MSRRRVVTEVVCCDLWRTLGAPSEMGDRERRLAGLGVVEAGEDDGGCNGDNVAVVVEAGVLTSCEWDISELGIFVSFPRIIFVFSGDLPGLPLHNSRLLPPTSRGPA